MKSTSKIFGFEMTGTWFGPEEPSNWFPFFNELCNYLIDSSRKKGDPIYHNYGVLLKIEISIRVPAGSFWGFVILFSINQTSSKHNEMHSENFEFWVKNSWSHKFHICRSLEKSWISRCDIRKVYYATDWNNSANTSC